MERPRLQDFLKNRAQYADWQLCPICRGGRGMLMSLPQDDPAQAPSYKTVPCLFCQGDRIIPAQVTP